MDVVMEGMDGFKATRELSKDPATASIPVVMVTTKDQESDRFYGPARGRRRLPHQAVRGRRAGRRGAGKPQLMTETPVNRSARAEGAPVRPVAGDGAPQQVRAGGRRRRRRRRRGMGGHRFPDRRRSIYRGPGPEIREVLMVPSLGHASARLANMDSWTGEHPGPSAADHRSQGLPRRRDQRRDARCAGARVARRRHARRVDRRRGLRIQAFPRFGTPATRCRERSCGASITSTAFSNAGVESWPVFDVDRLQTSTEFRQAAE